MGSPPGGIAAAAQIEGATNGTAAISAIRVATGLDQPVFATAPSGDGGRLFIVERTGTIKILDLATGAISVFLDISDQISTAGEGGLLGLAFDPNYAENGYFYVDLTNTSGDTEVRRYQVSPRDPNVADPTSMTLIISVHQPDGLTNHKAGWIGFGPGGKLYVALGDGGGGGDPNENAQNGATLLGKILRLDVHGDAFPTDPARNYSIPSDNPFIGTPGVLSEIWALGLRNPFRNSFDRATGQLYIADVGERGFEEIDLGQPGANYGWDVFEGPAPFEPGPLGPGTLTDPIYSYDHTIGRAVIGGYVYRGPDAALQGKYFFADEVTGKVFTLEQQGTTWVATDQTAEIATDFGAIGNPTSFAEDAQGNLYIIDFDGEVFRLSSAAVPCFCAGTLIATADGEVPVEALRIGDEVLTLAGRRRRIRWIGRRPYDPRFVAGNPAVLPIRIEAGALADDVPARDLWVSPEHALYFDAGLVAARLLVNGATIRQAGAVERLSYYNIELDSHDVIIAEGAAVETFVDCDNRGMFHNGPEFAVLYPDHQAQPWQFCATRLEPGSAAVEDIRRALLTRAEALGRLSPDHDMRLAVDGGDIGPGSVFGGGIFRFVLRSGARSAMLMSRSAVPAEVTAGSADRRRLGVAVERIVIRTAGLQIDIAHDCAALADGFHADEGSHRWTDGCGLLPDWALTWAQGDISVEVHLVESGLRYPVDPARDELACRRADSSAARSNRVPARIVSPAEFGRLASRASPAYL